MLSQAQREAYHRDGFIVVPGVFSAAEIAELRAATDGFVVAAARVSANDAAGAPPSKLAVPGRTRRAGPS